MADIYSDIPELSAQQAAILRRQKIADMIRAKSMQPLESQTAGGYVVPTNPLLALGKLAEAYIGRESGREADTMQSDLANQAKDMQSVERQKIVEALTPKAETQFTPDMMPGEENPFIGKLVATEARNQTPQAKLESLIGARGEVRFPDNQKWGDLQQKYLEGQIGAAEKTQLQKENAQIAAELAKEKLAEQKRSNQANEELKRLMIENKGNPQKEKMLEKQKSKEEAMIGFAGSLDSLEENYKKLDKLGGIVNPKKSGIANLGAKIGSSGIGQIVGGAFGTEEQSLRNEIKGTIPLLVLDIKNITGASAQQMNSNVELQNFMRAASDPNSDIKANLKLLQNLRKKYLGGSQIGASGDFSSDDAALLDKYK